MIELLKAFLTGAATIIIGLAFLAFIVWVIAVAAVNYPWVFGLGLFVIASCGVGYDIRKSRKYKSMGL